MQRTSLLLLLTLAHKAQQRPSELKGAFATATPSYRAQKLRKEACVRLQKSTIDDEICVDATFTCIASLNSHIIMSRALPRSCGLVARGSRVGAAAIRPEARARVAGPALLASTHSFGHQVASTSSTQRRVGGTRGYRSTGSHAPNIVPVDLSFDVTHPNEATTPDQCLVVCHGLLCVVVSLGHFSRLFLIVAMSADAGIVAQSRTGGRSPRCSRTN